MTYTHGSYVELSQEIHLLTDTIFQKAVELL